MNVVVFTNERFYRAPDSHVYSDGVGAYEFWRRYLQVFSQVRVVARVAAAEDVHPQWRRTDGEGVCFRDLPYYIGPMQYALKRPFLMTAACAIIGRRDAVIFRIPGAVAAGVVRHLRGRGHPFGVEVVGDPWEALAPEAIRHPLRPWLRRWMTSQQQHMCLQANAVAYVTEFALQARYPASKNAFSTYYSSIDLGPEAFVPRPRSTEAPPRSWRVLAVGSLEQMYKGPDVLIDAAARCVQQGYDLQVAWLGDGRYRTAMERYAAGQSLQRRVRFLGHLPPGAAVREELDQADLFVLPSRSEGLPRALIEAMARGLPSLGSDVGGVPELLTEEDRVPLGDSAALSQRIVEVMTDPKRQHQMSIRNLVRAAKYRRDALSLRRQAFYEAVAHATRDRTQRGDRA